MGEKRVVTYSELSTFKDCRQRHSYIYHTGWRAKYLVPATLFGAAGHRYLENRYMGFDPKIGQHVIEVIYREFLLKNHHLDEGTVRKFQNSLETCLQVMENYDAHYGEDDILFQVAEDPWGRKAVEYEGKVPVYTPAGRASSLFEIAFKLDLVIEIKDGPMAGLWIVDHKFREEVGQSSFDKLVIDFQMLTYTWALSVYWGVPVRGVLYNLVSRKIPSEPAVTKNGLISKAACYTTFDKFYEALIRQQDYLASLTEEQRAEMKPKPAPCLNMYDYEDLLKARLHTHFFYRHFQEYSEKDLRGVQMEIYQLCKDLHGCEYWYKNEASCDHWGGCHFRPLCMGLPPDQRFEMVGPKHVELDMDKLKPPKGKGYSGLTLDPQDADFGALLEEVNPDGTN